MKLGSVIRKWRLMSELDLRTVAAEMNLDASTLLRIEQGKMPSGETLRSILLWLIGDRPGCDVSRF